MPIEATAGSIRITGDDGNLVFALVTLRSALYLQTKGIRAFDGTTALAVARNGFGIKAGTAAKALVEVDRQLVAARKACTFK